MNQLSNHWPQRTASTAYPAARHPRKIHVAQVCNEKVYSTALPDSKTLAYVIADMTDGITCTRIVSNGPIGEVICRCKLHSFEDFQHYLKADPLYESHPRFFQQLSRKIGARFQ
jgi:hypothetical protein